MKQNKIGQYEIISEMEAGVEGVYRAHDPIFDREVMIVDALEWRGHINSKTMQKFLQKAKTLVKLEHPSLAPVYDVGELDNRFYYVTKIMIGDSLADRMLQKSLSLHEISEIISRIAPGLDEAHRKGFVHGNLKPGKILFDNFDQPYV